MMNQCVMMIQVHHQDLRSLRMVTDLRYLLKWSLRMATDLRLLKNLLQLKKIENPLMKNVHNVITEPVYYHEDVSDMIN